MPPRGTPATGAMAALADGFFLLPRFAVVGASNDPAKFGNKVLVKYLATGRDATPVHPTEKTIAGRAAVAAVGELGSLADVGVSVVTPPKATATVLEHVARAGGRYVWCQPGSEFDGIERRAAELNLKLLWGGACVLIEMDRRPAKGASLLPRL